MALMMVSLLIRSCGYPVFYIYIYYTYLRIYFAFIHTPVAGVLCKVDPVTGEPGAEPYQFKISENQSENREHYEKLANQIPEIIYELLEQNGLKRTYIPFDMPVERSTFVFTQPQTLSQSKKLLVLIHGSGFVRAGQWARKYV